MCVTGEAKPIKVNNPATIAVRNAGDCEGIARGYYIFCVGWHRKKVIFEVSRKRFLFFTFSQNCRNFLPSICFMLFTRAKKLKSITCEE